MIDITGIDKANILLALYNNSKPQGFGFLDYDKRPMTYDEAKGLLERQTYFDYIKGRIMKVDLSSDTEFDEWLYDRDNGAGAAKRALESLRK